MTTVMFVLGMARSGTSALARVMSLSGATLPPGMIGARKSNPRGFWEPRRASALNEKILRRHHSTPIDPTLRLYDEPVDRQAVAQIHAYLTSLPQADLHVIKEIQLTSIARMWFEAARIAGYQVGAVIAVRHPHEVIKSLMAAMPIVKPEFGAALWLKNSLLAERYTRGLPREFVEYPSFLQDWHREVKRVAAALDVDLNPDETAINDFLDADGRHHQAVGPACPEPFGTDWLTTTYDNLHQASSGETWSQHDLDRVFCEYRASEPRLRAVLDTSRRMNKVQRLVPRELILEMIALAHGRKGTWA